jgi:hypothetical protein
LHFLERINDCGVCANADDADADKESDEEVWTGMGTMRRKCCLWRRVLGDEFVAARSALLDASSKFKLSLRLSSASITVISQAPCNINYVAKGTWQGTCCPAEAKASIHVLQ